MVASGRLAVYIGMYANSIAFTVLFPFASLMVQEQGMATDRSSTGFWVGLLGFALMGGRMLSSLPWGIACDKWGRRPALLIGTCAVVCFSLIFGLSTNYWMAFASRVCLGSLCCLSLVGFTIISELTNSDPGAIGWVVLSWQMGNITGNIVGGVFADPNRSGMLSLGFFDMFPFLLPNLVVCLYGVIAFAMCAFKVPETLNRSCTANTGFIDILKNPTNRTALLLNFLYSVNDASFNELISLWCWAQVADGGFAMSTFEIGNLLGISSVVVLLIEGAINNLVRRRTHVPSLLRKMTVISALVIAVLPALTILRETVWVKYVALGFMSCCWWIFTFFGSSSVMTLQNRCVSDHERGKMNGLGLTINSAGKAFAPLVLGSLFALTSKSGWPYPFNFALAFYIMALVFAFAYFVARRPCLEKVCRLKEPDNEDPLIECMLKKV